MCCIHCSPNWVFPSALPCPQISLTLRPSCCVLSGQIWTLFAFVFNAISIFPSGLPQRVCHLACNCMHYIACGVPRFFTHHPAQSHFRCCQSGQDVFLNRPFFLWPLRWHTPNKHTIPVILSMGYGKTVAWAGSQALQSYLAGPMQFLCVQ